MSTIFNPYQTHEWFYNGPDPTIEDHEIALDYIKNKRRNQNGLPNNTII
jgi:hypothetical protein